MHAPNATCDGMELSNVTGDPLSISVSENSLEGFGVAFGRLHGTLSMFVCAFGVSTNIANIIVLTRPSMSTSATNHLLIWLAVADLITMFIYLPSLYHFYIVRPNPIESTIFSPSKPWVIYQMAGASGMIVFHSAAVWITVILAIFRFIHVGFPTIGPRLATKRRALQSVLFTFVCCIILVIPNVLINRVDSCIGPGIGSNRTLFNSYYYYLNFEFAEGVPEQFRIPEMRIANFWLQATLFKIIPVCLLSILTVLLIYQLRLAMRRRQSLQRSSVKTQVRLLLKDKKLDERSQQGNENRTTLLLLVILSFFLLVEMPQGIMVLCIHLIPNFNKNVYHPLGDFIDFITLVNESINFVIYATMSRQFRETFCDVFYLSKLKKFIITKCRSAKRKHNGSEGTNEQSNDHVMLKQLTNLMPENAETGAETTCKT
ncbi:hypothetical protein EG68_03956 [Paragonimus skrjabini miyazakii]|uniref:G-protein coupled receptors family 1 profile domain-containing protein n=1 Tax=Paragonimus skrjabini miyazakii TaxID=59628 RepID=A0A8S9YVK5_9TREM|nr:hypothetical protein EG68_03956 [Paragonimus skrjabini miyazakii]